MFRKYGWYSFQTLGHKSFEMLGRNDLFSSANLELLSLTKQFNIFWLGLECCTSYCFSCPIYLTEIGFRRGNFILSSTSTFNVRQIVRSERNSFINEQLLCIWICSVAHTSRGCLIICWSSFGYYVQLLIKLARLVAEIIVVNFLNFKFFSTILTVSERTKYFILGVPVG